jgi:ribose transport system substrate-binding protein
MEVEEAMVSTIKRRGLLQAAGLAATAGGTGLAFPGLRMARAAEARKFKIALSNSYIGNKWRLEMENVYKAALQTEPYASQVDGSWYNAGNNVTAQSQQISNLIASEVDAILIDAASPVGLNGILRQATARGIVVVSFDSVVTEPSVLKVNISQYELGKTLASWLAKKLNGQGNVIMVTGVAGTQVDEDRNKGADDVWRNYPGIKVVNRYTGMWDSSTAERNTAAVLPSLPRIDGIWCQGGTDGVLKAFIAANRPLPPTAGECENGFRKFMIGYMGHKVDGISIGSPPLLSVVALEVARRVLNKTYPKQNVDLPLTIVTSDTVKVGETVFPELPDSFFDDFTGSGPNAIVRLPVEAALKGTAKGSLVVNLPVTRS